MSSLKDKHILLGVTGSVAAIRSPSIVKLLLAEGAQVRIVVTSASRHFLEREDKVPASAELFQDADEWHQWEKLGDPVLHIDLKKWADALVIAPLDANTLTKIATGLCDNLLTSIVRAWDILEKPLLVAPAMNTAMWEQPLTVEQLNIIQSRNIFVVPTISKKLACGDVGFGAMASPEAIVEELKRISVQTFMSKKD
eukprot:jgi/Galph1/5255/GphlegSOOS_G3830.1